jgi:RimK-like ATP-grasp domain
MILLCGVPSEPPLAMVAAELQALDAPYLMINQRRSQGLWFTFEVRAGEVTGALAGDGWTVALEDVTAAYVRLMDHRSLPELRSEPPGSTARLRGQAFHGALLRWCEIAPALVVNRARAMGSNSSKPYQAQLIRAHGFEVPETLVTNDPELVRTFRALHARIVYKSLSGVRSIVRLLTDADIERLASIRWCPVQFQAYVTGLNVRVHVVGEEIFATAIATEAVDYRYAPRDGQKLRIGPTEVTAEVAARCRRLTRALGLELAGIDLKVAEDGRVYCFEVNPSPAYSYYQLADGQPIARSIARYLADAPPRRG